LPAGSRAANCGSGRARSTPDCPTSDSGTTITSVKHCSTSCGAGRIERFADTAGWAAWADARETFHSAARAAFDEVWQGGGRLITTSYILAELTALFTRLRLPKPRQIQFVSDIRSDPSIEIVQVDAALEIAAWTLWAARPDKNWTIVDCVSFVVMGQRGLTEAITSDRHFEQAGFVRLLK
jgi:uncharacterized protein